ncbi:MAG: type II 3-dehydroquinate dehydratase [Nitrosomonadales bacterium]|jgi:3-dehydroquinate dehydratase-2|nr:type II 3-dehydroquinate dehydratase [Nitrosomonadales bacterium]MBT3918352.1 type II 3-dehydroquinate dehydratase [Nitrosomonadales bacterium]MBT4182536.1 type II 3-dehydroquinate dehydratase [Nitrosomonadales bacterium]MBT4570882.1 type II 3-dehydroquinate dehydratase [Nitrosomonadales bacterium]MBT4759546.1 type II 3-dehydroquinate dehydratase [Nitrosomonadales bacterium]
MLKKRVSIIHGPNLNLLGKREPEHYGNMTLEEINSMLINRAKELNIEIDIFQSNSESEIIDKIQSLSSDFTIINPAAFTHSSVAIRDSLVAKKIKFIEIHLSNVFAREAFRKNSFFSDVAVAIISGLGPEGYVAALNYINQSE